MYHFLFEVSKRNLFFSLRGSSEGFFISTCKKIFYYTHKPSNSTWPGQGFLKLSSKRGHILWNVTTKKNLLLLHTCRVYRISHLLIRLRKGMFRYFLKKNSHLPDISDQMPNFFKESYQTYLSEARHQKKIVNSLCLTI